MSAPSPRGPRLREHGLRIGRFDTGPANAITDVSGVTVGHVTVWRDEPEPPEGAASPGPASRRSCPRRSDTLCAQPLPAGTAVLNGAGELTGSISIANGVSSTRRST
jgi:D-aminopeptidase